LFIDAATEKYDGAGGLPAGDQGDECVDAHGLYRWVGAALFADRRGKFGGQVLSARRPSAVCRHHGDPIGKRQQLLVDRPIHRLGQIGGRTVTGVHHIRTAHVADEQRITGQNRGRLDVGMLANQQADRLPGVSRRR
jgi:hypothetical protein